MSADRPVRRIDTTPLLAVAALVAGLAALGLSAGTIPSVPTDPTTWPRWWSDTDPALALGAVLRTLAMLCAAHLLVITVVDLVAAAAGLRGLARLAHRLAPAAWRAVVLRPLTAGALAVPVLLAPTVGPLTTAVAAAEDLHEPGASGDSSAITAEADVDGPVLTMTWGGAPPTAAAEPEPEPAEPPATSSTAPAPTIVVTPPDSRTPAPVPPPVAAPSSAPAPASAPDAHGTLPLQAEVPTATTRPSAVAGADHVVRPGDSFWSIAEERVAAQLGRAPSAGEVGAYWRRLVVANADRLPVAGNADLIYAGMVLVLPED